MLANHALLGIARAMPTTAAELWARVGTGASPVLRRRADEVVAAVREAKAALDHALAAGTLAGLDLGEAQLDHARVLVAENDLAGARTDLNAALANAPEDPLAWLLSATLARRMGDLPRAKADIAHALERASDDASVQLEAGNIAARDGDEAGARAAWTMAMRIAPTAPAGISARAALSQFGPIPSTVTR